MIFVNRNLDMKCVGGVVFDLQIQPAFRHRRVNSLGNAGRIAVKVDSMCMLLCNSQWSMHEQPIQETAHLAQPAPRQQPELSIR